MVIKEGDWKFAIDRSIHTNFLDILFWFDDAGQLQTDIYIKPTDSRAYLHYHSCHPKHIFPGIVYTQALRHRRIINEQERLNTQLNKLKVDFYKAKYPKRMVNNIIDKVKALPRIINQNNKHTTGSINNQGNIRIISTHGRDQPLTNIINTMPNRDKFNFTHVKRTAPSLNNMLCRTRQPSLGPKYGFSRRCMKSRCKCCRLMSGKDTYVMERGGRKIKRKTAAGDCRVANVVYLALCKLCYKHYVGKTTQQINARTNLHRGCFVRYVKSNGNVEVDSQEKMDRFAMGMHLYNEHGLRTKREFDEAYEIYILEVCSPRILDVREHMWIHKLKALEPHGINIGKTFGFSLLS